MYSQADTVPYDHPAFQYGDQSALEPLTPFLGSDYVWRAFVVPRGNQSNMAALAQVEDRVSIAAGSFLLASSAHSQQTAGFRFRIFDLGANAACLSDRWDNERSGAQDLTDPDAVIHILPEAYVVVSPGLLQVSIANLANASNQVQLVLHFAVPRGRQAA